MTRTELDSYRNILMGMIRRISNERTESRSSIMQAVGGERTASIAEASDAVDPGTASGDSFLAMSLLTTEEQMLSECHAAMERIERGSFGRCEHCKKPISRARLKAVPYARNCVMCERKLETTDSE